jgi:hypothetical protein
LVRFFKTVLASFRNIGFRQKNTIEFNEEDIRANVLLHISINIVTKIFRSRQPITAKGRKHITVQATTIAEDFAILRFCNFFSSFPFAFVLAALRAARHMETYIYTVITMAKDITTLVIGRATGPRIA